MAENEKKTIPSVEGMEAHIDTWRDIIKNKQRGIFAFDELVEIKLKALKKRIYTDFENTAPWKMRECIYKDIGDYEYLYDGWKDLDVGGYWGGNGLSSFFKNKITIRNCSIYNSHRERIKSIFSEFSNLSFKMSWNIQFQFWEKLT